ncbi:MAG TPA: GTP cyclohydrolase I FolE [Candidatus Dormibacteraeota bacterium]|nr:GTP cyclohydrolase I FolE [Candidatus Dormibacteraeota bacterium]
MGDLALSGPIGHLRPTRDGAGRALGPPLRDADATAAREGEAADLVEQLLGLLGEDAGREGLVRTPTRVARSLRELTAGYEMDLDDIVNDAVFEEPYSEMVVVRDIELYSLCEHHLLPFFGSAHVAYIPDGRVLGLSKLARIVDLYARRLQVQERLTTQVADALMDVLAPLGVAVVVEASHLCMMMRGVQKQNSRTLTSSMRGVFLDDPRTRRELMDLLRGTRADVA